MTEGRTLPARRGICFEDFEVGQTVTTAGRTVTEADIVAYASLSGAWTPIHVDAEYAARQPFGQRVAHGLLGLCIAEGLTDRLGLLEDTVLAFREIGAWKFSLPIFIGDTIRVRATVSATKAMPRLGGGLVTLKIEVLNQNSHVAQRGSWTVLVKRSEA